MGLAVDWARSHRMRAIGVGAYWRNAAPLRILEKNGFRVIKGYEGCAIKDHGALDMVRMMLEPESRAIPNRYGDPEGRLPVRASHTARSWQPIQREEQNG